MLLAWLFWCVLRLQLCLSIEHTNAAIHNVIAARQTGLGPRFNVQARVDHRSRWYVSTEQKNDMILSFRDYLG
jgi:hypothetical protein